MKRSLLSLLLVLSAPTLYADELPECPPGQVLVRDASKLDARGRPEMRCEPAKAAEKPRPQPPAAAEPAPAVPPMPSSTPATPPPVAAPPPPPPTATPEAPKPEPAKQEPRSAGENTSNSACSAQPSEHITGGLVALCGLLLAVVLSRRSRS